MRQSWTDDRLDDLNGKVDALRLEAKTEFAAVRGELNERFDKVDDRFERTEAKVDDRFDKVEARFERMEERFDRKFDALSRQLVWLVASLCVGLLTAVFALVATQL